MQQVYNNSPNISNKNYRTGTVSLDQQQLTMNRSYSSNPRTRLNDPFLIDVNNNNVNLNSETSFLIDDEFDPSFIANDSTLIQNTNNSTLMSNSILDEQRLEHQESSNNLYIGDHSTTGNEFGFHFHHQQQQQQQLNMNQTPYHRQQQNQNSYQMNSTPNYYSSHQSYQQQQQQQQQNTTMAHHQNYQSHLQNSVQTHNSYQTTSQTMNYNLNPNNATGGLNDEDKPSLLHHLLLD
jgi:hypothetical protein